MVKRESIEMQIAALVGVTKKQHLCMKAAGSPASKQVINIPSCGVVIVSQTFAWPADTDSSSC